MCKHQELVNKNENANKISGTKSGLMQPKRPRLQKLLESV